MYKMKASSPSLTPLVSPEELQGLLGTVPTREQRTGQPAALLWVAVLAIVKASLLLSLTRLPLASEAFQAPLGTYVGLRFGLELALMSLLTLAVLVPRHRRWSTLLATAAVTTLVLDLLAWAVLGS